MNALQQQALDVCGAEYYYELSDYIDIESSRDLRITILNGLNVDTLENLSKLSNDTLFDMVRVANYASGVMYAN